MQIQFTVATPFSLLDLAADISAHLQVKIDQNGINRLKRLATCGMDQINDLSKCCFSLIFFAGIFKYSFPWSFQ